MPMIRRLFRVAALQVLVCGHAGGAEFHVSPKGNDQQPGTREKPFATVVRARDAVRALKRGGALKEPVTVVLAGGIYPVSEGLVFGPEDSGSAECPVVYKAADGQEAVIDGGRKISGWKKHNDKLWVAELPEVASGKWWFRQLYWNDTKMVRARKPNTGFLKVFGFPDGTPKSTGNYHTDCQTFEFKPGDIRADWKNLSDVEVIVYHFWTDSHLPIQKIDETKNHVTFVHKAGKTFTDDFKEDGARYIVENVFEELDAPGEWYLDRKAGRLYLHPPDGGSPAETEIIAPVAGFLLNLEGSTADRKPVEHIHFKNLAFRHTHFQLPVGNSNDRQGSASIPAAIRLRTAKSCSIEHCDISRLGTFAIDLMAGCSDIRIAGNEIGHIAAGGIRVGGGKDNVPVWERTYENIISDNHVHNYGIDYPSAVGVLLTDTYGNMVSHNHIHHGGYTGISIGWVWGYTRSVSQHNLVEFNHIHDIGGILSDMGGIYTLGVSPGTLIHNNHIHDVTANHYGGWGIYHDEGSTGILVEDNVVHHTKFAPFNIHFAKEITVRNNIFALGTLEQLSRGRAEPHKSLFFENNIVYWIEGELLTKNWKDVPYLFHHSAKQVAEKGLSQQTSTFDMNWNLYFNPGLTLDKLKFRDDTWESWRKRGKDTRSLYADPLFVHPQKGDFTLKPGSPALAIGFKPIDVSTCGPRIKAGPDFGRGQGTGVAQTAVAGSSLPAEQPPIAAVQAHASPQPAGLLQRYHLPVLAALLVALLVLLKVIFDQRSRIAFLRRAQGLQARK